MRTTGSPLVKLIFHNLIVKKEANAEMQRVYTTVKPLNSSRALRVYLEQLPMSLTYWHTPTHPYKVKHLFGQSLMTAEGYKNMLGSEGFMVFPL